jgi:hypothetical protein
LGENEGNMENEQNEEKAGDAEDGENVDNVENAKDPKKSGEPRTHLTQRAQSSRRELGTRQAGDSLR